MKKRKAAGWMGKVKFNASGLVPAIVADRRGEVLMLAWMNAAALGLTAHTGLAHFYSRSRRKLWKKGEESGHVQRVREIRLDCDGDAVLLLVRQEGPGACHTGFRSCFHRALRRGRWRVCGKRRFDPRKVYRK